MKIAAYNVENLFDRAKVFNEETAQAQKVVKLEAELKSLLQQTEYKAADKKKILELMKELGIKNSDEGPFVILRKIRGQFIKRSGSQAEIVANGRGDWVGWVELKTTHVNDTAIMNTGRVIRDVDADVIAIVEAEDRIALKQFCIGVLAKVEGKPYPNIMLIDGNDDRGIDVGLMTKAAFPIGAMRSHVHDMGENGRPIFSRDCPEYCVETPQG